MNRRLDFDCLLKATGHLKITNKSLLFKDNKSHEKTMVESGKLKKSKKTSNSISQLSATAIMKPYVMPRNQCLVYTSA